MGVALGQLLPLPVPQFPYMHHDDLSYGTFRTTWGRDRDQPPAARDCKGGGRGGDRVGWSELPICRGSRVQ